MANEVFLDTSFAIALSSPRDKYHDIALSLAEQLESKKARLITTTAILLEIGNALSEPNFRQGVIQLLSSLEDDPMVDIMLISEALYLEGFRLYSERLDKSWGLVGCLSFAILQALVTKLKLLGLRPHPLTESKLAALELSQTL